LHDVFIQIVSFLITDAGIDSASLDYLIDLMPVIVANERRSGSAKAAGEICDKGYCSSKKMYYYGVKVHALAQKQHGTLPNLFAPPAGRQAHGLRRHLTPIPVCPACRQHTRPVKRKATIKGSKLHK
jgi:hypothetical protein